MPNRTLVIENVDFARLEKQRHRLVEILTSKSMLSMLAPKHVSALEGLLNMLDHWSDVQYTMQPHNTPGAR